MLRGDDGREGSERNALLMGNRQRSASESGFTRARELSVERRGREAPLLDSVNGYDTPTRQMVPAFADWGPKGGEELQWDDEVTGLEPIDACSVQLCISRASFAPLFNVLCTMAGTGILQLPYTLRQGGWFELVVLCGIALATNYTGKALIACLYASGDGRRLPSYPAVGRAAFGTAGEVTVQVFHKSTLVGVSTLFLILAAGFLKDIFPAHRGPTVAQWVWICAAIGAVPVLVFKTLKEIVITSVLGVLSVVGVVVSVIIVGSVDSAHSSSAVEEPTHDFLNWSLFPSAFAATVVSFGGHAVFPTIEEHAPRPKEFGGVLNWGFLILMALYIPISVVGYYLYGNQTDSPILNNLPDSSAMPLIVKGVIVLHILAAYPILLNVVVREIEMRSDVEERLSTLWYWVSRTCIRLGLVVATAAIASTVPFFPDFMTLIGAMCATALVFVLPCVLSFRLRGHVMPRWEWAAAIVTILLGLLGGSIGTYQACASIAKKLRH